MDGTYFEIAKKTLDHGIRKKTRTGIDAISISGAMFEHDMAGGFPLLTTKRVSFRLVSQELEFFVRGITDKNWLRDRGNHIWDEWCSPDAVPYGNDERTKERMAEERELGPVYGWQWRNFGARYGSYKGEKEGEGVDQLRSLVETLKKDPDSRRLLVSAWNPLDLRRMALPPCHFAFQVTVNGGRLNLLWSQRSADVALGLPFNIASYGCLLHLLAKEASLAEGRLVGFLGDVHIYENHVEALKDQMRREPRSPPAIKTEKFTSVFDWQCGDTVIENYDPHPPVKFEIAV